MSEGNICPRTGFSHSYWPQGNCQYCGEVRPDGAGMTIPTEILSRAREIYEGSWPDPVAAIAEALMEAREAAAIDPRTMSAEALEAHIKYLQQIVNENREIASW